MTDIVYFTFHDAIDAPSVNRVIDATNRAIAEHKPQRLCYLISSGGGSVDSGVTLYNYLRALPQTVIMHNVGSVDSIANAVFLAGKERYATPASAFLLHGVMWNFHEKSTLSYPQMQEIMSRFDAAEQLVARIIGEHTRLTAEEVRALFMRGESKTPQFAKDKGIIQRHPRRQNRTRQPYYCYKILRKTSRRDAETQRTLRLKMLSAEKSNRRLKLAI